MKVAIYSRVSTKEQNVQMQLDLCRNHCAACKYEIFEEYTDIGESGKKASRPAFDRLLEDMRKYKFKGIMVYKMDRIGRSLAHLLQLFEEFKKKSIHFTSVTQNIDSTTPEGRMFMQLMMVLAEYEREMTVDRVKAGIQRARKEGKIIGRPKLKVNNYQVLRMKNEGKSLRTIAKEMEISLGSVQRALKKLEK